MVSIFRLLHAGGQNVQRVTQNTEIYVHGLSGPKTPQTHQLVQLCARATEGLHNAARTHSCATALSKHLSRNSDTTTLYRTWYPFIWEMAFSAESLLS